MLASGFQLEDASDGTGVRRFVLTGELDAHVARGLTASIVDQLGTRDRTVHLVLDGLAFIDSAGLQTLVELERVLRAQDRELVLVNPSEPVRHFLQVADLDDHFAIVLEA